MPPNWSIQPSLNKVEPVTVSARMLNMLLPSHCIIQSATCFAWNQCTSNPLAYQPGPPSPALTHKTGNREVGFAFVEFTGSWLRAFVTIPLLVFYAGIMPNVAVGAAPAAPGTAPHTMQQDLMWHMQQPTTVPAGFMPVLATGAAAAALHPSIQPGQTWQQQQPPLPALLPGGIMPILGPAAAALPPSMQQGQLSSSACCPHHNPTPSSR